jgi:uncharacterized protein YdeI (YjbR/CyaY-like superfamily)
LAPLFFETTEALRAWFAANAAEAREVWIGFYKKGVNRPGLVYAEALDEALCFGWIDVLVRRIDDESYMLRFVPRKPKGNWTEANSRRVQELIAEGRMQPAGLAAYEARGPYSS